MNFLLVCVYCCGTRSSLLCYERETESDAEQKSRKTENTNRGRGQQQVTGWRQASSSFKQHDGNITHVHTHTVIFFGQWCQTCSHSIHSPEKQENRSLSLSTAFLNIMKLVTRPSVKCLKVWLDIKLNKCLINCFLQYRWHRGETSGCLSISFSMGPRQEQHHNRNMSK